MDFNELYSNMIKKIKATPKDIQTIPLKKQGIWFSTYCIGDDIFISPSKTKRPSSRIKSGTHIKKDDLEKMYPIYLKRKEGFKVSKEALKTCRVQVYCYAIFESYGV